MSSPSSPVQSPIRLLTSTSTQEVLLPWNQRAVLQPNPGNPQVLIAPASTQRAPDQALILMPDLAPLLHLPFTLDLPGLHPSKALWHFYNNLADRRLRLSVDLSRTTAAGEHLSSTIPTLSWRIGRIVLLPDLAAATDAAHRLRGIGYAGYVVAPAGVSDDWMSTLSKALNPPPPPARHARPPHTPAAKPAPLTPSPAPAAPKA